MKYSEEEYEAMIEQLEAGNADAVPTDVQEEYQQLVAGIQYLEETDLREKLDKAHDALHANESNTRYYWIGGIAASIAGGLIWMNSGADPAPIELQMDEAPVYADSASYDSLKNSEINVDKTLNQE